MKLYNVIKLYTGFLAVQTYIKNKIVGDNKNMISDTKIRNAINSVVKVVIIGFFLFLCSFVVIH